MPFELQYVKVLQKNYVQNISLLCVSHRRTAHPRTAAHTEIQPTEKDVDAVAYLNYLLFIFKVKHWSYAMINIS